MSQKGRLLATLLTAAALPPAAWAADDLQSLLAKPISAGSVALLIPHAAEPAVQERWAEALADPRAEVRAAAARVIHASGTVGLLSKLREALAVEQDPAAGREEIWGLAVLSRVKEDEPRLLEAAKRLGSGAEAVLLDGLARVRGSEALSFYFTHQNELHPGPAFFVVAVRNEPGALGRVASLTLGRRQPDRWRAVIGALVESKAALPPGIALAAIGSQSLEIRAETAWHVILHPQDAAPGAEELREAFETPADPTPPGDGDAAFGLTLLARSLGRPRVDDADWIARVKGDKWTRLTSVGMSGSRFTPGFRRALDLMTPAERAAVSLRLTGKQDGLGERLKENTLSTKELPETLRTVADLPRGYAAHLIAATGCSLKEPYFLAAGVVSGADGRPMRVQLPESAGRTECRTLATVLLLSSIALVGEVPDESPQTRVVALRPDSLECLEAADVRTRRRADPTSPATRRSSGQTPSGHRRC